MATPAAAPPPLRGPDRGKRDEWSEVGVLSLLEIYQSKWLLRNRAKLKGSDWEDIAREVSGRSPGLKTPIQCKNKIESMKKRYRSEPGDSPWQYYSRMDSLLKGSPAPVAESELHPPPKLEQPEAAAAAAAAATAAAAPAEPSNQDNVSNTLPVPIDVNNTANDEDAEGRETDTDTSAPRSKVADSRERAVQTEDVERVKRRRGLGSEIAESVRMLARAILKIEEGRMEMYRDSERMRMEAEIKRGEMELKRTEIVANTQLQIAKLFVRKLNGAGSNSEGSRLRSEVDILSRRDAKGD